MKIKCQQLSSVGAVRDHNEDFIAFWEPEDFYVRQGTGSIAVLADGVGGEGNGEVASRIAAETAVEVFKQTTPETIATEVSRQCFDEASNRVFQASRESGRMATTLITAIFRHSSVTITHVGDSRAYLIRAGKLKRLTTDRSYTSLQVRLGLILERNAMLSQHRSTLTRSIGYEPMCHYDITTVPLQKGDIILQCSDGLYGYVLDDEILETVVKYHPAEACKLLIALAEKRQVSDNVSLQIISVWDVDAPQGAASPSPLAKTSGKDVNVGTLLDDRFEITDLIAKSGMSSLFKATDRKTKMEVAIKVPLLQIESDAGGFERFKREEEIGLKLNHPGVLKVFPVDKKTRPYFVMEYLEGQTLSELLKSVSPLPEMDAAKIASRVCEALIYLHQNGIVHRDLKPQNVMICNDGSIRIMDFGIARSQGARRLTFVGFTPAMGTPDYMAPEQVKGSRGDERTDIYSVGAMIYEMVTGETPFGGDSPYVIMNARVTGDPEAPRKRNHKLTPVLEEIILHAMEREPKNRYQSAAAMKAELDDYEKVEVTDRCSRLRSPQVWKSSFRMLPLIIGIILILILNIFFLLYMVPHMKRH